MAESGARGDDIGGVLGLVELLFGWRLVFLRDDIVDRLFRHYK